MDKNKCFDVCEEINRLNNTIDTLSTELEVYKTAFSLSCNHLSKLAYPQKEWFLHYYLNRAKGV